MHLKGTMKVNNKNSHLEVGGIDCTQLVKEYGSPLWVIDEKGLRENCRIFLEAFSEWGNCEVTYASKSLNNLSILRIIDEEGLSLDVVSGGELYTALKADFPANRIYFHGNNKSRDELEFAVKSSIARVVVDNFYELELLNEVAGELGKVQDILLRITPGVEAHTHEYIQTGQIDSKFGFTLPDGQALESVNVTIKYQNLKLKGIHCHIGSQIFEMESFQYATSLMMDFLGEIKNKTEYECSEINVGGGFGIYYTNEDEPAHPEEWAKTVMTTVKTKSAEHGIKIPKVIIEPGRAISGPAGITLYTIGSSKEVKGVRKYIAVDGGMADNPRPALYGAKYLAKIANKANYEDVEIVSIAGKCCESGDMLIWDIKLPLIETGDILAVFATGAYNYSMSSNYNRLPKPAMVLVNNGQADIIVKREDYEDLLRNDVIPERLRG
ncbi:MAG TPA: diaminopimelate decarboxylase [Syntrophomonadaceae bacterium]|nr:diaminopimelate decarboxylase [Syntrophomonadaceae bacterium]